MRKTNLPLVVAVVAAAGWLAGVRPAAAQTHFPGGVKLNRWDAHRPTTLPERPTTLPGRPSHLPGHPHHPHWPNRWPWWHQTWWWTPTVPYYVYPPDRWDQSAWDGRPRELEQPAPPPEPAPQPEPEPQPPARPLVLEWNQATGRAEVRDLDRWDDRSPPAGQGTAGAVEQNAEQWQEGIGELRRWDDLREGYQLR